MALSVFLSGDCASGRCGQRNTCLLSAYLFLHIQAVSVVTNAGQSQRESETERDFDCAD